MTASSMSKGFFEFVKSIGEAKSKQEEDGIIENELHILKAKMGARNVGPRQMREYLIRMVYVEMLGHDASFGHIHAVKLTRASKLVDKRVGYMACSLCLHKDHELMLLLVGGLQTDLQSQNQLEVSTALIVACKLINEDTIPAILPLVNKLLNHTEATIRKKAIMVIQRFNELSDMAVTDVADKAKRMLCDKDPSVMGASLHLLLDLVDKEVSDFNDLVSSFVSILKQIIEHRLPKDYDYHRMPAPWTQIKLLQILALLGCANKSASEGMYEVLHEVMRRADIGINVGYAIIYECVRTVTTIYPNTQLLAEAAKCTSRFITSENHNLKYLGINALASIVQINPSAANEHQMIVIDCLEDKDETLRRKTLDLLYKMTNENNVNVICTKLIASLKDSVDVYLRTQLVEKITFLAEKFAPDTIWFIDTMSQVFELGADLVKPQFAHNFVKTLAEGIIENQEDEDSEEDIANYAADFFYQILIKNLKKKRKRIPNILMRIVAWVMGEYGQFCTGKPVDIEEEEDDDEEEIVALSPMEIIRTLWQVIEKQGENLSTRQWAMSATCKLCRHLDEIPIEIESIVAKYRNSTHSDLVQLSHELIELCKERDLMTYVFEESSVVDDIKVDTDLKFLNYIVDQQVKDGKRRYSPPDEYENDSDSDDNKHRGSAILIEHRTARQDMESMLQVQATQDPVPNDPYGGGAGLGGNPYGGNAPHQMDQVQEDSEPEDAFGGGLRKSGPAKRRGPWGDHVGRDSESEEDAAENIVSATAAKYDEPVISVATYEPRQQSRPTTEVSAPVKPKRREREMTAKEREAASLFGGLGGGASTKPKRRTRKIKRAGGGAAKSKPKPKAKGRKKQVQQQQQPEPEPEPEQKQQAAPQEDLLNFAMGGAPAQPKAAPVKQQAPADDLLGDIFGSGASSQPAPSKPAPAQQSGGDDLLGDLFGGGSSSNVAAPAVGGDIFGSLASSPSQNTNQQPMMGGGNRGFAALKSQLGAKVMGFPRSHDTDQILFENSQLQMSYFKIFKQQKSTLCIFISNLSQSPLSNIQIGVKKSNMQCQLQFGFDVSNSIPNPKLRNATSAIIPLLNGGSTACQMITFGLTNPTQISMPCNIIVSINDEILTIALKMSDLLRSSIISTGDFGTNWGKLSQGSFALNVNTGNSSIPNYINKITKSLHIHHIETIKNEIIAAGILSSIVNTNMLLPILIHCKCIQTQSYSVIIRTPNVNISKAIGIELQQLLSS